MASWAGHPLHCRWTQEWTALQAPQSPVLLAASQCQALKEPVLGDLPEGANGVVKGGTDHGRL